MGRPICEILTPLPLVLGVGLRGWRILGGMTVPRSGAPGGAEAAGLDGPPGGLCGGGGREGGTLGRAGGALVSAEALPEGTGAEGGPPGMSEAGLLLAMDPVGVDLAECEEGSRGANRCEATSSSAMSSSCISNSILGTVKSSPNKSLVNWL